jgi:TetR/AcrR family transcriptional repressor of mexJK operon
MSLFLRNGYGATTMDEIAGEAGLTKRTLYNNYANKAALFTEAVTEAIAMAEGFARALDDDYFAQVAADPTTTLHHLAERLATAILRPRVIALRRLLVSEAGAFPHLPGKYFDRAPGAVLGALTRGFQGMKKQGVLNIPDARLAAEHFAYLAVGALLDEAILVGKVPPLKEALSRAEAGVRAFLVAYGAETRRSKAPARTPGSRKSSSGARKEKT